METDRTMRAREIELQSHALPDPHHGPSIAGGANVFRTGKEHNTAWDEAAAHTGAFPNNP